MDVIRALVVDDYPDTCDALCALLEMFDVEARGAPTGQAALEAVAGFEPTIVFLDLSLPAMDGFEVARRLRQARAAMPYLVALTGQHDIRARASEAGFDDVLLKPARAATIRAILDRARLARRVPPIEPPP